MRDKPRRRRRPQKDDYDDDYDDERPEKKSSNALVIVIVLVGVVGLMCFVVPVIAAIAIPNLAASKKNANEAMAIGSMRALSSAQAIYAERNGRYATTLKELGDVQYIDSTLAGGTKAGYEFELKVGPEGGKFEFEVTATPATPATGSRRFMANQSGIIFYRLDASEEWLPLGSRRRRK